MWNVVISAFIVCVIYEKELAGQWWYVHTFNPGILKAEAGRFLHFRSAGSIE